MTEAELEENIRDHCRVLGIYRYHVHDSRRSQAGWVDDVLLGSRGALFAECKSEDGRRSLAQIDVATRLVRAGLTYRLWRPSDWLDGTIAAELQAIR